MTTPLRERLGIELPIIQAPMAGTQGSALAIAVSSAGGLGSLPCALLDAQGMRAELQAIAARTDRPVNLNFFCHAAVSPTAQAEERWRTALAPYLAEWGIDPGSVSLGPQLAPFGTAALEVIAEFKPAVVSFHFGLPSAELLAGVRAQGAFIISSATTVEEALWLEAHGVDAVIAQGLEAGGHRGIFLSEDLSTQIGTLALLPQVVRAVQRAGHRRGRHRRCQRRGRRDGARRVGGAGGHRVPAVPRGDDGEPHASCGAAQRAGAPHRGDQPVHRAPGARDRQPFDARARADVQPGAGVPAGAGGGERAARATPRRKARTTSRRCGAGRTPPAAARFRRPNSREN